MTTEANTSFYTKSCIESLIRTIEGSGTTIVNGSALRVHKADVKPINGNGHVT